MSRRQATKVEPEQWRLYYGKATLVLRTGLDPNLGMTEVREFYHDPPFGVPRLDMPILVETWRLSLCELLAATDDRVVSAVASEQAPVSWREAMAA